MTTRAFSHLKPADFGANGITGSADAAGRIIALNAYDAVHGYITLTSADPFPDAHRYDAQKVRQYRADLPHLSGFGAELKDAAYTVIRNGLVQSATGVPAGTRFRGKISLQRCAYTQLTEGGVLPMPPLQMTVSFRDGTLVIVNKSLARAAAISGFGDAEAFTVDADRPFDIDLPLPEGDIEIRYAFGGDAESAVDALKTDDAAPSPSEKAATGDLLVKRGLIYGQQMCIPVGEGVCILTDHMLLPLSWNRDAYFIATALMHGMAGGGETVRRHLVWMFEIAERPDGDWGRCYLANGKIKDNAYQLDQQLYPVLELADYVAYTGDTATLERLRPLAEAVLNGLEREKHPQHMLYATEETPGDDPIAQPFHLSSHILLWRTLMRWSDISGDPAGAGWAREVREAVEAHFVTQDAAGRQLYAYATDGRGGYHLYYDANDLPFALAPAWGFCDANSPTWRVTVDFAFSSENSACFGGRLGSVHTPAPWSLGDLQDVVIARALGDTAREEQAWARLRRGAATDGALPEAYDGVTGAVVSRTWFAWPNATAACIQLGVWP